MLKSIALHQKLENAAHRHQLLASRFNEFAMFVEDQVTQQAFQIKGIAASLHLDHGFFSTTFSGRTLNFVFSSTNGENGALIGNVQCYLKREFPETRYIEIGEFTFTENGQTNLLEPEVDAPITIDAGIPSIYVALHFIEASLSSTPRSGSIGLAARSGARAESRA